MFPWPLSTKSVSQAVSTRVCYPMLSGSDVGGWWWLLCSALLVVLEGGGTLSSLSQLPCPPLPWALQHHRGTQIRQSKLGSSQLSLPLSIQTQPAPTTPQSCLSFIADPGWWSPDPVKLSILPTIHIGGGEPPNIINQGKIKLEKSAQ